ncbi:amidase [Fulvimarina endophytica]|uniref:Indoleacetamide hydrolase n=1 Tax=Fulvimarina endophytica TaxID=2293836 RepID=A0A371X9T8_9HYPH|nr:amidase [Fulvimarina endophytica]RFC65971.1 amidase [Fulvimarina endophytica]
MTTGIDTDATDLADALRNGRMSALEAVDEALGQIRRLDGALNAFVTIDEDGARATARALDEQRAAGSVCGPLHGVPIAIKDVTATKGLRTTQGSRLFANFVPKADALSVSRLREAGAIILGKTNTPEFAFGAVCTNDLCGPTRNPYDTTRTSGGSSGGSAVAVATGMAALAQGTDFGGSVRMPASFCGIVGLRPAPGTIADLDRSLAFSQLATEGVLARSVRDAFLMLGAMSGSDPRDPLSIASVPCGHLPDRARIAASLDLGGSFPVDHEVASRFEEACAEIETILGPLQFAAPDMTGAFATFKTLRAAESWFRSRALVEKHADQLSPSFVWNVRQGEPLSAEDYLKAEAMRSAIWRRAMAFFERFDLLVMPSCSILPFANEQEEVLEVGGQRLGSIIDYLAPTAIISLIGFPALSIPAPRRPGALPFGLQLVVPPGREPLLREMACRLERNGFRHVPPELAAFGSTHGGASDR